MHALKQPHNKVVLSTKKTRFLETNRQKTPKHTVENLLAHSKATKSTPKSKLSRTPESCLQKQRSHAESAGSDILFLSLPVNSHSRKQEETQGNSALLH